MNRDEEIERKGVGPVQNKCPGLGGRNLRIESYRCPRCGAEVEIFSDEAGARCQKCGEKVSRETAAPYATSREKDGGD